MPSPFPGMDPYLERPEFFPGLHDSLLIYLREGLQGQLPAAYYADIRSRVVKVSGEERSESFLETHTVQGDSTLVTAVELLSPSNKTPGAHGCEQYLKKQAELLNSRVNLVEIDLLRGGQHTTAVPRKDALQEAGPFDYHV